jgi:hypothetical protein
MCAHRASLRKIKGPMLRICAGAGKQSATRNLNKFSRVQKSDRTS